MIRKSNEVDLVRIISSLTMRRRIMAIIIDRDRTGADLGPATTDRINNHSVQLVGRSSHNIPTYCILTVLVFFFFYRRRISKLFNINNDDDGDEQCKSLI